MVFVVDTENIIRASTDEFARLIKKGSEEIIGRRFDHVFDNVSTGESIDDCIRRGMHGASVDVETWMHIPSLGRRCVRIIVGPVFNAEGTVTGSLITLKDLTDYRTFEKAIVDLVDQERRRIAMALHDGPCHMLLDAAIRCALLSDRLSRAGIPESVEISQMTDLINRAIANTREIVHGLNHGCAAEISVVDFLREKKEYLESQLGIVCVVLVMRDADTAGSAIGDHLCGIVQEAIDNIIKHANATAVGIELIDSADSMVLRISDNGIGIDTRRISADGMGLHIMKLRARAIGGELSVESSAFGGTSILCRLCSRQLSAEQLYGSVRTS